MTVRSRPLAALTVLAALAGCSSTGDIVVNEGVGIQAVRSACPAVGIPEYTGDVTMFRTPGVTTADNIDVVAAMTNVRTSCNDTGDKITSQATFDVLARRIDTRGARQVTIPYFSVVLRGGSAVIAKRVGQVTLNFADWAWAGPARTAQASGSASAFVDRAEATLPADIRDKITRERKAGEADAAIDPLSLPEVKAAVARATFELLVGFQLDQSQLNYNGTR